MSSTTPHAPSPPSRLTALQTKIWSGSVALRITLAPADCRTYDDSEPYLIQFPRLSYLAFLLPRLHAFFRPRLIDPGVPAHDAWLEFDGVPLKWHFPLGLLFDLFAGVEPAEGRDDAADPAHGSPGDGAAPDATWRLVIHYTDFPAEQLIPLDPDGKMLRDWYINGVKEADFLRNGSARPVMGLGREDSDNLWESVRRHDLALFNGVNHKLLYAPGVEMRHVPIKVYLPAVSVVEAAVPAQTIAEEGNGGNTAAGHFRVVQALASVWQVDAKAPQTLGTALHRMLPTVFPSRRNPLLAQPVLHGAVVPMSANLEELGRAAAYTDGFLHVVVSMFG